MTTVRDLTERLLAAFPLADAEDWDHVGLSVGDPDAEITGVACALDATATNVACARELGANVLLTHHPVYISAPDAFTPASPEHPSSAAAVYEAARTGVSIISLHTNLDRSLAARRTLPELMGLAPESSLEHASDPDRTGLGALCNVPEPRDLDGFAYDLARAFGCAPRIWGAPERILRRVAFLGGSLGGFGEQAIAAGADAVICGEAGYHVCQDLVTRGLAVILLGHDRSEEPFTRVLADAAREAGIASDIIHIIPGPRQWWTATEGVRP